MKSTLTSETDLISRLFSIEKFIPSLEAERQNLVTSESELKRMIDEYKEARFNLFKARLKQEKRGWCTSGRHFVPASGLRFLFTTGKYWKKSHESDYLREYNELHRACPACRRKEIDLSGSTDGSAIHLAYQAKKNGKKFLYKNHGQWTSVPEETEKQKIPSHVLTKALAAELGLPKEINYTCCPFKVIFDS